MTQFRKAISGLLTLSTALTMTGLGMASTAYGAQLRSASVTLSDPRPATSSEYTISFSTGSAAAVQAVRFEFRREASVSGDIPAGVDISNAELEELTFHTDANMASGTWEATPDAGNGWINLVRTEDPIVIPAVGTAFSTRFSAISNPLINANCDVITGSESCFIRITTYAEAAMSTVVDTTTVTYTVTEAVQVTATIDPILQFTVNGVNSASVASNDSVGAGTAVTSTSTTLPFGNVTVGTPKMAQQRLRTQTNANGGYTVYGKFYNVGHLVNQEGQVMFGNGQATNNIDKFVGSAGTATWEAAADWASPTGNTQNVNSAWLGVRTNDGDAPDLNFTAGRYAPPDVYTDPDSGQVVMWSNQPDNGTSSVYVTFKIEANAFQPADSYEGRWVYNVVATY